MDRQRRIDTQLLCAALRVYNTQSVCCVVAACLVWIYGNAMPKRYDQACPVAKSLELIGDRWTLLIVRDLLHGACRFQDLQASLKGIAPTVLSDRLKLMEEHGLAERRFYSNHPPRAEYLLTDKGRELGVVVGALALVHADCEQPVQMGYYCPHCDQRVRGTAVQVQQG
jgi:DNA-binding HxlR family transcriptional regulator